MQNFKKLLTGAVCFCLLTAGCKSQPETVETQPEETTSVTTTASETESVETTQATTSVTETETTVTEIETTVAETKAETSEAETTVAESETEAPETVAETSANKEVRALTNPLTKEAAAPFQVKVSNVWKVYWINVSRSDLYGMKPDDFKFFDDYINEHFEADACEFYVVVTDVPDLCFQFTVTKSEYVRSTCAAFAGITKTDSSQHYPYCGTGSCAIRYNDPEQFEMQALTKDKYGLEQYDDSRIYHFSEFGDDMFAQLDELQRNAR